MVARALNLTAELIPRASDVDIPASLFPTIPPFCKLKKVPKIGIFPGAVLLRRFRKGEVICRQGEPGWTAFYIPTADELDTIRKSAATQSAVIRDEIAKNQAKITDLEKQLAEAAADPKKSASIPKTIAETREKIVEAEERLHVLQNALPTMEASIAAPGPPEAARASLAEAGDAAMKKLRGRLDEATKGEDLDRAAEIRGLIAADTATKAKRAGEVQAKDPELAGWLREIALGEEARKVASVHLAIPRARSTGVKGLFSRLGKLISPAASSQKRRPRTIPIDAPRDLDYETREGVLNEGELFGEMSCLYRSPRSATVTAVRDCYMLEMLRNVLDAMNRDEAYKSGLDQTYRERVLRLQLANLDILVGLDERLLERLSQSAELVDIPSGGILYDENERSDGMHLIRSGIIKVMQNVSFLIGEDDVTDWPALRTELAAGKDPESGPLHWLWSQLPGEVRDSLEAPGAVDLDSSSRRALLDALNELIKEPELERLAGLAGRPEVQHVGRRAWRSLADPRWFAEREMVRCQRRLLETLYGNKMPARSAPVSGDDGTYDFRVEDIGDWKGLGGLLVMDDKAKPGDPKKRVWDRLSELARAALLEAKTKGKISLEQQEAVVDSLNALVRTRPLLIEADFQEHLKKKATALLVMEFAANNEAWVEHDFHRGCRAYNRFLLDVLSPKGLGSSRRPDGPPKVIGYRSRGEAIGEMSLIERKPRTATCVAYGHPEDDPEREVGPIQLVRISRELFDTAEKESPAFRKRLEDLVAKRKGPAGAPTADFIGDAGAGPDRTEELGLIQGQRLMLVDLERCTRCDECVRACVNTHDDGRSRLFLDGPRYGKYLVPTTCRSCRDPVCMIGCPVGSIHKGTNGEIVIEEWCIGCEACANQCPYGAIQIHKIGLIAEGSFGWEYAPAAGLAADWFKSSRASGNWQLGRAPFVLDREFRERLAPARNGQPNGDTAVAFRYEFEVPAESLASDDRFIMRITSMDEKLAAWLNGKPVVSAGGASVDGIEVDKSKSRDYQWWEFEVELPSTSFRAGRNVIAVTASPATGASDRLLDVFLDREQGAAVKLVEEKAVVCDLCSAQAGQRPACVTACPHDAAIRINALSQLPLM